MSPKSTGGRKQSDVRKAEGKVTIESAGAIGSKAGTTRMLDVT